jgi:hypothetical protein
MVVKGNSLAEILDSLCRLVEAQAGDVLASILLVDGDHLRHGGAPPFNLRFLPMQILSRDRKRWPTRYPVWGHKPTCQDIY